MKPVYVQRPSLLVRRILEVMGLGPSFPRHIELAWGMPLRLPWDDSMTRALYRRRVYDLPVSEALWRLIDPGLLP